MQKIDIIGKEVFFVGINNKSQVVIMNQDDNKSMLDIDKLLTICSGKKYIGGYKDSKGDVMLEPVRALYADDVMNYLISFNQESAYKCRVTSKILIGSNNEWDYAVATILDLMQSLLVPYQGFTIMREDCQFYLLVCSDGEYIKNPLGDFDESEYN